MARDKPPPKRGAVPVWLPSKAAFEFPTPEDVPKLHGLFLLAGTRGSGKSVAAVSLLKHYQRHKLCDRVIWVSPTVGSNRQFLDELGVADEDRIEHADNSAIDYVEKAVESEARDWDEYQKKTKLYKKLTGAAKMSLDELLDCEQTGMLDPDNPEGLEAPKSKYGHKPCLHLVLDDVQGSPLCSAGPRSKLTNLAIRHRHCGNGLGISMYMMSQSYASHGSLPRAIRENCTAACIWPTNHASSKQKMAVELADRRGPDHFLAAYDEATQGPHEFLVVDHTAPPERRYRKGWGGSVMPSLLEED